MGTRAARKEKNEALPEPRVFQYNPAIYEQLDDTYLTWRFSAPTFGSSKIFRSINSPVAQHCRYALTLSRKEIRDQNQFVRMVRRRVRVRNAECLDQDRQ